MGDILPDVVLDVGPPDLFKMLSVSSKDDSCVNLRRFVEEKYLRRTADMCG